MPVIPIHVGRIDFGQCSGMIYSFEDIPAGKCRVNDLEGVIHRIRTIQVQTPEGYVVEKVHDASPNSDTGFERMLFDADQTRQYGNGRIYLRAARVVERLRDYTDVFSQVG